MKHSNPNSNIGKLRIQFICWVILILCSTDLFADEQLRSLPGNRSPTSAEVELHQTQGISFPQRQYTETLDSPSETLYPLKVSDAYLTQEEGATFSQRELSSPFLDGTVFLRVKVGGHYFDASRDSRTGGFEGGSLGIQLPESCHLLGTFNANHFSEGSQFGSVAGLIKTPQYWQPGFGNQWGYGMLFGQYTDTRIAELYISQLRLHVDYALTPEWRIGVNFTEPITRDRNADLNPHSPGTRSGTFSTSRRMGGHLKTRVGPVTLQTGVGYRDKSDSVIMNAMGALALNEQISTYTALSFDEGQGTWTSIIGFQYVVGPRRRMRRDQYLGVELPNEVLKVNNIYSETEAIFELENAERDLFHEGVQTTKGGKP